ncbi:MAG: hypothetical protein AB8B48_19540 [Pseudomonadales bacterium]
MKQILISIAGLAVALLVGGYLFKDQLKETVYDGIVADMYVSEDNDDFDPGVVISDQFPGIKAIHNGQEISRVDEFIKDKGMIFIANRSVDW